MTIAGGLEIIAWKAGKNFTSWHLARDEHVLCGIQIPGGAARCRASHSSGPLLLEELCRRCLLAFANEE